jgi:fatty-acyl-CoA synthase
VSHSQIRRVRGDVRPWCEAITVGDLLLRAAEADPPADAIVFPDARLSFAGLSSRARLLARGLIRLGVGPRDRVGILMPNSPDCVAALFAVALTGATAVPINIRYRAVELPFVVRDAELSTIVSSDRIDDYVDLIGLLQEALPGLAEAPDPPELSLAEAPALRSVVALGRRERAGTVDEAEFLRLADGIDERELEHRRAGVRLADDAVLLYTSGTTSLPRGCRLTHEALVRSWTVVAQILRLGARDRLWAPCPMFHLAAIGPTLACCAAGAALISDTYFDPGRALRLIAAEGATHLYPAYPPITEALLDDPRFASADLSSARAMLNVGAPETLRKMQAAVPDVAQVSLYGSTEGGGAITFGSLDDDLDTRVTTCGLPLPGTEVRIVDPETGEDVPVGEIRVRSFGLFGGYANDAAKTDAAFDAGGWYRTGDRGALDGEGRLRFLGRLKEMLKVGGENVAPAEIEAVLSVHPAVKLVQVVGVPDARLEEVPAAFVETKAGTSVTADELMEYCRNRIARFKLPRYIRFVSDWPMSATKIQKGPLREQLLAELSQAAD